MKSISNASRPFARQAATIAGDASIATSSRPAFSKNAACAPAPAPMSRSRSLPSRRSCSRRLAEPRPSMAAQPRHRAHQLWPRRPPGSHALLWWKEIRLTSLCDLVGGAIFAYEAAVGIGAHHRHRSRWHGRGIRRHLPAAGQARLARTGLNHTIHHAAKPRSTQETVSRGSWTEPSSQSTRASTNAPSLPTAPRSRMGL